MGLDPPKGRDRGQWERLFGKYAKETPNMTIFVGTKGKVTHTDVTANFLYRLAHTV